MSHPVNSGRRGRYLEGEEVSVTCSELWDLWERQSQDQLLLPSFPPSFLSTYLCQALEGVLITPKEHGKTSYSHCLLILLSAKESGLLFLFYKGSSIFIKKLRLYFYKEKIFLKLYFLKKKRKLGEKLRPA